MPTSTGDQLRTYRLALITDPGYSTYHGGPQFVTAAKVALMNRVSQIYEDDFTIRLQLVPNNDLLNFNNWDMHAQRALRRRPVLHAVPGHRLLEHQPGALHR